MGSLCSTPEKKEESCEQNHELFNYEVNGVNVCIVKGEICEEQVDAIVSGTDNYLANRNSSIVGKAGFEQIQKESEQIIKQKGAL
jgi:hypothetical protein